VNRELKTSYRLISLLFVGMETSPARRVTGRGGSTSLTGTLADADALLRGLRFVWRGFRPPA